MYLEFNQTVQEMYSAQFDITENGSKVGQASIQGWLGGEQGNWTVNYRGRTIFIGPIQDREFNKVHPNVFRTWRPQVIKNGNKDGVIIGYHYQEYENQGLLKNFFGNEKIHLMMEIDSEIYESFGVNPSFDEGGKMCIYDGNNRLVSIGGVPHDIYDGMRNYQIISSDEKYVLPTIIQICRAYAVSGFNPGQKIKKGHQVISVYTKDEELRSKYDPAFEAKYR